MGTCLSQEYILGQEAINNALRQDIAKALEAAKETQNTLASAPKRQEEVEALRLVTSHEREIADLKKLVALRAEVDELKLAIKSDPNLVLSEIKEELNKLQEKVTAIKEIKSVSMQLDDKPIFGSFRSNPEGKFGGHSGWGIVAFKEGAFGQAGSAISITKAGVYNS